MLDLIGFEVTGFIPFNDIAWSLAGPDGQKAAMREASRLVLTAMHTQLAAGLDKRGVRMAAISHKTKQSRTKDIDPVSGRFPYSPMGRANPDNPALQATGARSRSRTLLRARITADGVFIHWAHDPHTGKSWGVILAKHASGFWQKFADNRIAWVPPRDVIGLSPRLLAWFQSQFAAWWRANRKRLAQPGLKLETDGQKIILKTPIPIRETVKATPTAATAKATKKPLPPRPATAKATKKPLPPRPAKPVYGWIEHGQGRVIEGLTGGNPFGRPLRGRQYVYYGDR